MEKKWQVTQGMQTSKLAFALEASANLGELGQGSLEPSEVGRGGTHGSDPPSGMEIL